MSTSQIGPIPKQYAAAATVPLIKSPSLYLPPPVELPNDIHPLPDDITAYFVYPFTLEQHVVGLSPPPHIVIAERRAHAAAVLHAREAEEEARERAELHKRAPGYHPNEVLAPTSKASPAGTHEAGAGANGATAGTDAPAAHEAAVDPMDVLVAQLEEMESGK